MTLEQANKIVNIWGKHLEYANSKLMYIFSTSIPESFLPFPKETIEEASNIVAKSYHDIGNQEAVKTIQSAIVFLTSYVNDDKAILQAARNFNNQKWRKTTLPSFKKFQVDWMKTQDIKEH